MPDYQLGKIYKVINDVTGMVYIGSTAQSKLSRRMTDHRAKYKRNAHTTYERWGDINDCKIFLIENYPCQSRDELLYRERHYVENTECINTMMPIGRPKDYHKIYYRNNKEKYQKKKKSNDKVNAVRFSTAKGQKEESNDSE